MSDMTKARPGQGRGVKLPSRARLDSPRPVVNDGDGRTLIPAMRPVRSSASAF